jgi:hypothetical protein
MLISPQNPTRVEGAASRVVAFATRPILLGVARNASRDRVCRQPVKKTITLLIHTSARMLLLDQFCTDSAVLTVRLAPAKLQEILRISSSVCFRTLVDETGARKSAALKVGRYQV